MSTISPKGKYRLWEVFAVAVLFVGLVGYTGGLAPSGWFFKMMFTIGEISVGALALYYISRRVLHERMHHLAKSERLVRSNYMIIAIAIVVGCALL